MIILHSALLSLSPMDVSALAIVSTSFASVKRSDDIRQIVDKTNFQSRVEFIEDRFDRFAKLQ